MGNCCGDAQNNSVNSEMNKAKEQDKYIKKLLFLGSGGSGKSTLFKQLRTIHGEGYAPEDRMTFIDHIHAQIIDQMKIAIECVEFLGEDAYGDDSGDDQKESHRGLLELSEHGRMAVDIVNAIKETKLSPELAEQIKLLWQEPAIIDIYNQRAIMKLEDSSKYFWDSIDRIMQQGYIPDARDILLVRYRTTGVIEQSFKIQNNIFNVFDVGGQKSERKKWINCFENVTAVIFVASLSCYDEVMFELEDVNSMDDSLVLFDEICNNEWFTNTSMILFLNKKDLFAEKIVNVPITECPSFAAFPGDSTSFEDATNYIRSAFTSKNRNSADKSIFTHLTCATDEGNVQKVFNDVQHIIIENSLMSAGLMGDTDVGAMGGGPADGTNAHMGM